MVVLSFSSVCHAQFNQRGPQVQIQRPRPHKIEGSLENMAPGLLNVVTEQGVWLVGVNQQTLLTVSGTAEPSYLRAGLTVRFEGDFDSKGIPVKPVKEITIFTPRVTTDIGVAPAQGGFAPEPDPAAEPKKDAKEPPVDSKPYSIGGKLTGLKNTGPKTYEIQVDAGSQTVKAPLAEDVKILIEVADLSIASKGDKVIAEGTYTVQGQLVGREINIEMQKPLAGVASKARTKKRTERGAKELEKGGKGKEDAAAEAPPEKETLAQKRARIAREKAEARKK
jgi:hypothetical protein